MAVHKKEVTAEQFAAEAAALLHEVTETGEEIVVVEDGNVVAMLTPGPRRLKPGPLAGSVLWQGDIISPIDDEWTADEENFDPE
jgi:antitoxin (DNA-binding transcriptional repressor) of toxin-antitoxin stability system